MDLCSPPKIKEILLKHQKNPIKSMGQNFLIDKNILNKIIFASELQEKDVVLEIGPGIGTLTQKLSENSKKVIAIEKDDKMTEILKETLYNNKNVEIINQDILKIDNLQEYLKNKKYKLISNLPYYITSPIIRKFLENEIQPQIMVLMVQKEVAQRICQKPPNMSILSVSVQFYAEAKIICYVSKNCFLPSPKVDSAIIKITPFKDSKEIKNSEQFFKIVKAGFSHPRKQLANNFSNYFKKDRKTIEKYLLQNNILPNQRAECLLVSDWKNLTNSFSQI